MPKRKKSMTFCFDTEFIESMDRTKLQAGLASKSDVIRRAVMLYKHIITMQDSGARFIVKENNVERELVIL